jgi:hypothetical protein
MMAIDAFGAQGKSPHEQRETPSRLARRLSIPAWPAHRLVGEHFANARMGLSAHLEGVMMASC